MANRTLTMHTDNCECLDCFSKYEPFSFLPKDVLKEYYKNRRTVIYKPGEIITKQGKKMKHIISIFSGLGKVYLEGMNGYQLIFQLIKKGEYILGPGLYTDYKYHYSISAISKTTACVTDFEVFMDLIKKYPQFARMCHKTENLKKIKLFDKFVNLTQKQMTGRIAEVLLYLHEFIYQTNPFKMDISRSELGDMTALCKESTTRVLRQFENDGIINLKGKKVEILDLPALKYFSEVG